MAGIVFVGPYRMECGLATHQEGIERYLDWEVMVLSENLFGNRTDTKQGNRKFIRCFSPGGSLEILTSHTIAQDPALIHIQHETGLFPNNIEFIKYLKAMQGKRTPVLITVHSLSDLEFINTISRMCSRVIFNTREQLERLNRRYPSDRYIHIPVGIPEPNIIDRQKAREKLEIPDNTTLILSTGFICPTKNILRNIKILSSMGSGITYMIAGMPQIQPECAENERYYNQVKEAVVGNPGIILRDKYLSLKELGYYYSAADILLCNYDQVGAASGSGNALMGTGYGIPSICSRSLLLDDIDNNTCLRIPCNDDMALMRAIRKLRTDRMLYGILSKRCLEKYQQQSWRRISEIHKRLYEDCIIEKHNKPEPNYPNGMQHGAIRFRTGRHFKPIHH